MKSSTDTSTLLLDVIMKFSSKTNNTITDIQKKELTEYGISFGHSYDDCTHIVCYPEEYENIKLKVRSPESLYFVTPKFVTDILTYGIRFQEVVDIISQHLTHIIVSKDNINSEFIAETVEKTQGIILDIEWLEQCLRMKKLVDESPYIIERGKNTNIIKEKKYYCSWSNNLRKTMYIVCKNLSQFQQSLLSKYHLYFSPMIDPYKSLYLQEISSYHGAIISKTITHSTHIISYCDIYKSKTRLCLHPNWLLISIENSEVVNVENDDKTSPNSPSAFEIALSRSTPQKHIKEFNQKIISVVGFSNSTYPKLHYIESAIRMLGGSVIYTINNNYATPDYIIYNVDSDLLDLSEIENIPILTVDWIIHCLYEWKFVEQFPYLLSKRLSSLESILFSEKDNDDNSNRCFNERMEEVDDEEEKEENVEINDDSLCMDNVSYNSNSQQSLQQQQQQLLLSFSSPQSQDDNNNNIINDNLITQSEDICFQSNDVVITHHYKKHKNKEEKENKNKDKDKEEKEVNILMNNEKNVNEENVVIVEEEEEKEEEKKVSKDKSKITVSSSSPDTSHVDYNYESKIDNSNAIAKNKGDETNEESMIKNNSVVNEKMNNNNKSNSSSSTSEESSVIILPNIQNIIKKQEDKSIEKEKEKEKNKSDESTVSLENSSINEMNKSLNFDNSQSDNSIQYFNKQTFSSSNQTEDSISPPILPSPNKPKLYQPSIQTPLIVEKRLELIESDEVLNQEEKKDDYSMEIDNEEDDKKEDRKEENEENENENMEIESDEDIMKEKEVDKASEEGKEEIDSEDEPNPIQQPQLQNEEMEKEEVVEEKRKPIQEEEEEVEQQDLPIIHSPCNIHFTIPSQLFQTQSQSQKQQSIMINNNNDTISQSDGYSHFIFRSNSTPIKPSNIIKIREEKEKENEEEETKTSTKLKTKSRTLPTPKSKRKLKELTTTPNKKPKRSNSSSTSKSSSSSPQKSVKQLLKQQFKNVYLLFSNSGCSEYKKKAKDLGLSVLETKHDFSSETTHLITNEMKRTIKVLCALCSGIYILKPSFITELESNFKKNKISSIDDINMDEYEWNEKVKDIDGNCSKFWRNEKVKTGHGAFYSRTFIISDNTIPPSDKLCEIIESGEGIAYVQKFKPSVKKNYEDKIENKEVIKKIVIVESDWKLLKKYPSNIEEDVDVVLTTSYILDYISHCKDVNITDYLL